MYFKESGNQIIKLSASKTDRIVDDPDFDDFYAEKEAWFRDQKSTYEDSESQYDGRNSNWSQDGPRPTWRRYMFAGA